MKNCQRDDVTVRIHKHTHKHSLIHMQLCMWKEEGGGKVMLCNTSLPNSHLFTHTHIHTHSFRLGSECTRYVCLCPIWYPLKRFSCPPSTPLLQYAICMQNALPECRDECVSVWLIVWVRVWVSVLWIDLSLSLCAFDLQFVSLASFFFYVRFGHSCNFICSVKGEAKEVQVGVAFINQPLLSILNGYSYFCTWAG